MKFQVKKLLLLGASVLFIAGILTGCKTRRARIAEYNASIVETSEADEQLSKFVAVNNARTARALQIVEMKGQYLGDLLKAQVSVVNKYRETLQFRYQFTWFNSQGMEINSNGPWQPLILNGNESKNLQSVAPNPSAKDYKISIMRSIRNIHEKR